MGIASSIGSAISSGFSSVGNMISSATGAIASGLSSAASWCGEKFGAVIDAGKNVISGVGGMAGSLMQSLGIFGKEESPKDFGDRALQAHAQEIFPEKFDDFSEYMQELRDFKLDPEESKKTTDDQKTFKGLEVAGRALEHKFKAPTGSMANAWVLAGASPEYFTSERFVNMLNGRVDIASVVDYFEGNLGGGDSLDIEDQLVDVDQKMNPDQTDQASREKLYSAVAAVRNILN